ncbi:MAG: heparan-alpha-glucosaminide N-acetyltransferase domain-containing protein, partial [Clostridia bacterium]
QSNIRSTTHIAFIVCFAILSGISSSFSRNNLKRGIKMAIFAVLFSLVTYGLSIIIKDKSVVIVFNIIHVLSLCVLFWALCDFIWSKINSIKLKNWYVAFLLALALAFVIIGSCYMKEPLKESKLFFLVECGTLWKYSPGDSAPLLPYLGWFVFGALAGKLLYKEKKTLFPTVNSKYVSFFTMCGRYSLVIYFGSQVVMAGLTYVLVKFLHWL